MENLNQNQTSPGNSSVQLPEKEPTPISPSFYRKPLIEDNDDTSIQAPEQELPQSKFYKGRHDFKFLISVIGFAAIVGGLFYIINHPEILQTMADSLKTGLFNTTVTEQVIDSSSNPGSNVDDAETNVIR